jgi:nicotinamidase-related amidase
MARALLIIDIQNDYFPGGAFPLADPEAAAASARSVLERFRAADEPVIHLQHASTGPDARFMIPGTEGQQIHEAVAPIAGETVIEKGAPNGFVATSLEDHLRDDSIDELIVCGMMTSMCVDATVRAASDMGFGVTVVHDACAAPSLQFQDMSIEAPAVHGAFLAALGSRYATVVSAEDLLAELD